MYAIYMNFRDKNFSKSLLKMSESETALGISKRN